MSNKLTIKISDAADLVERIVRADMEMINSGENTQSKIIVPYLVSSPGLGKSTVVRQVADSMGIGFQTVDLAHLEWSDVAGWNLPNAERTQMTRIKPDWMPAEGTKGILFFDELAQAMLANKNVFAQIADERRIGPFSIPDGWVIVAAGNEDSDRAGTSRMPTHLRDRLCYIHLTTNVDDVVRYFNQQGEHESVIAFLRFQPDMLSKFDVDAEACPSPRSWQRVSQIMRMGLSDGQRYVACNGTIGPEAATAFSGYLRVFESIPDMDLVLTDPDKVDLPKEPSAIYAVVSSLASRITLKNSDNVMKYMARLNRNEFTLMLINDSVSRDPSVQRSKSVAKWLVENGHKIMI